MQCSFILLTLDMRDTLLNFNIDMMLVCTVPAPYPITLCCATVSAVIRFGSSRAAFYSTSESGYFYTATSGFLWKFIFSAFGKDKAMPVAISPCWAALTRTPC